MSVCVTIRTENRLQPDVFLKHLVEKGEDIVVTSDDYPSVKFGNPHRTIRGIEVNKEDNGLEVRVCTFSSTADYQLFANTVGALMELTGDKAYLEDDDDAEITDPFEIFNDEWIESQLWGDACLNQSQWSAHCDVWPIQSLLPGAEVL